MAIFTNRQRREADKLRREEDEKCVELLRLLNLHPERRDLIYEVEICRRRWGTEELILMLTEDGLETRRVRDEYWLKAENAWKTDVVKEQVQDYKVCVELFSGFLSAERIQELLAQFDA